MKEFAERTALRLSLEQRQQIDALVKSGTFKSLSHVVREALKKFLN